MALARFIAATLAAALLALGLWSAALASDGDAAAEETRLTAACAALDAELVNGYSVVESVDVGTVEHCLLTKGGTGDDMTAAYVVTILPPVWQWESPVYISHSGSQAPCIQIPSIFQTEGPPATGCWTAQAQTSEQGGTFNVSASGTTLYTFTANQEWCQAGSSGNPSNFKRWANVEYQESVTPSQLSLSPEDDKSTVATVLGNVGENAETYSWSETPGTGGLGQCTVRGTLALPFTFTSAPGGLYTAYPDFDWCHSGGDRFAKWAREEAEEDVSPSQFNGLNPFTKAEIVTAMSAASKIGITDNKDSNDNVVSCTVVSQ